MHSRRVHDFGQSLSSSKAQTNAPWWPIVYEKAFGPIASMVAVNEDGWAQRAGIDRLITLPSGRVIEIDEKVRFQDWGDICLEYLSDERRRTPGWVAKPLKCEFIAYAFIPSQRCFLLPTLGLQAAWREHSSKWIGTYKRVAAVNRNYTTVSVAVPIKTVLGAVARAACVSWAEGRLI